LELSDIYAPVRQDLEQVEDNIGALSEVDNPDLGDLLRYCLKGGGKRLRPVLTLLSGKCFDYDLSKIVTFAVAAELMHMATLVHDDTIDDSAVRWGRPTVYSIWGTEKAVLLGDYMFARAGEIAASTDNLRVIKLFSRTLKTLSSAEITQASSAFNLEQTMEQYLGRISGKTASLFVMCTEAGAVLSNAGDDMINIMIDYGYNLGVAFQIVDDIFDFISTEEQLGKPVGSDLSQGTMTLPSMMLIERYPEDNPVKKLFQGGDEQENINKAIDLIRNSTIIQDCFDVASEYCSKACQNIGLLPDTSSRQTLLDLADYIVSRRR